MKTIDLTKETTSLEELLQVARDEPTLLRAANGESFLLSAADELTAEVELLRLNHDFLAYLDEIKGSAEAIPLEEVERRLG